MALVIMAMISELHLHGKLESQPLQVPGRLVSSVTKSHIEM